MLGKPWRSTKEAAPRAGGTGPPTSHMGLSPTELFCGCLSKKTSDDLLHHLQASSSYANIRVSGEVKYFNSYFLSLHESVCDKIST